MLLVSFYTPWKQKILMFSGVIERDQWHEMGYHKKVEVKHHFPGWRTLSN